jgi:hypothetical protein
MSAHLDLLTAWRRGAGIALALPPVAGAAGVLTGPAAVATMSAATALAVSLHRAVNGRRTGPRQRRLAATLRRTAVLRVTTFHESRVVPLERLAPVRADLLAIAEAVATADRVDPAVLDELETLLRDGVRSPLLNTELPAGEVAVALRRARFNLAIRGYTCSST